MIITKKALPRRTFLRGAGATLALPLLDAMVPSMTALAATPAAPVRRLGFVYIPMGAHMPQWTPAGSGALGELTPTLAALAPVKEHLAMDLLINVGQCDNGYACVYQNNLSWSSPTNPLPAEAHPRIAFERLFGEGGTSADRLAELRKNSSLLDWMKEDISRLQRKLGA